MRSYRWAVPILLGLAALLFFCSAGGWFLVLGQVPLPPLDGITGYGCTSTRLLDGRLRAVAYADYDEEHVEAVRKNHFTIEFQKANPHRGWAHMVSERAGKKADRESAQDCVDFNRRIREALVANLKKEKRDNQ